MSKTWVILVIVITSLFGLAAGYAFSSKDKTLSSQKTETTPTDLSLSWGKLQLSDWQEYTANAYNYTFKYPQGLFVSALDESWVILGPTNLELKLDRDYPDSIIRFSVIDKTKVSPAFERIIKIDPNAVIDNISLNGLPAVKISYQYNPVDFQLGSHRGEVVNGQLVEIAHGNYYYDIEARQGYQESAQGKKLISLYDQILDTFKIN